MLTVVLGRVGKDSCRAEGMIKNFNTIEEFKRASKPEILQKIARTVINPSPSASLFTNSKEYTDIKADLGRNTRWIYLLSPLATFLFRHSFLCGPEEI